MVLKHADFSMHETAGCQYRVKATKLAITDVVLGCAVSWGQYEAGKGNFRSVSIKMQLLILMSLESALGSRLN